MKANKQHWQPSQQLTVASTKMTPGDCTRTWGCGDPCRMPLRTAPRSICYRWHLPSASKRPMHHLQLRQTMHCTQAVHFQSTLPKTDQEFQAWWKHAGVKADALLPEDFAGMCCCPHWCPSVTHGSAHCSGRIPATASARSRARHLTQM